MDKKNLKTKINSGAKNTEKAAGVAATVIGVVAGIANLLSKATNKKE